VSDATEDDLYEAMDWLLARQDHLQKKLAARHLKQDGLALYDLSSSYFEGSTCPLAKLGYSRDSKKGLLQVNYGLLTDPRGCPLAVSVYEGNTADPETLMPELQRLKKALASTLS
jgi:transposase